MRGWYGKFDKWFEDANERTGGILYALLFIVIVYAMAIIEMTVYFRHNHAH